VILEDDEPGNPTAEAPAVSALVDTSADPAFKLSNSTVLSKPEQWYDVEAGCYVEEELALCLKPEWEGLAAFIPAHDHGHSPYHSPKPSHDQIG
jgi:hypothetical protein